MADDLPLEYVSQPPEDPAGTGAAVLFLHGRGADEEDLLPIAEFLPERLHVFSVRAPARLDPGYTWYELDLSAGNLHESQPDTEDFRRSLDLVHEFVDTAVDQFDLDPDRVGLLGFSQGAVTSLSALIEQPTAYRWVVALNGYLAATHEDRTGDAREKPIFIGAGEMDQVIPVRRAERAADQLEGGGADVTFRTYRAGHGTTPEEIRDVADWLEGRL